MAREQTYGRNQGARSRVLDLIAYGLLLAALACGTGCPSASVSPTRLPPQIDPPSLRKPIVLLVNDDGFFVAQDKTLTADELWGMTPEDAQTLQTYLRALRADYLWMRDHPAFKR